MNNFKDKISKADLGWQSDKTDPDLFSAIAWQGWQIRIEPEWMPLKIEGDFFAGSIMIGTPQMPLFQVKWRRFDRKAYDSKTCLLQRFKIDTPDKDAPLPKGFATSSWKLKHNLKNGRHLSIWVGSDETQTTIIEIISTSLTEPAIEKKIFFEFIPDMILRGKSEDWNWIINGVKFSTPGSFRIIREHLYSGDIALQFKGSDNTDLLLRQLYPAKLAISRRTVRRWIDSRPFNMRRKQLVISEEPWNSPLRNFSAIKVISKNFIPFPFHWLKVRHAVAIAAIDENLDRLLIAESTAKDINTANRLCENSILKMNYEK